MTPPQFGTFSTQLVAFPFIPRYLIITLGYMCASFILPCPISFSMYCSLLDFEFLASNYIVSLGHVVFAVNALPLLLVPLLQLYSIFESDFILFLVFSCGFVVCSREYIARGNYWYKKYYYYLLLIQTALVI